MDKTGSWKEEGEKEVVAEPSNKEIGGTLAGKRLDSLKLQFAMANRSSRFTCRVLCNGACFSTLPVQERKRTW